MKKKLFGKVSGILTAGFLLAATFHPTASKANVDDGGSTTITCPEGDTYKCYEFSNGGVVYKGKGDTIVKPS
ncbi:hypothetical protein [Parafilimonas sp.]|uniref:hypothetical protein n=1 Tax=Parafilimonas sp. TaxID=1969739 RepID=UPI003F7D3136